MKKTILKTTLTMYLILILSFTGCNNSTTPVSESKKTTSNSNNIISPYAKEALTLEAPAAGDVTITLTNPGNFSNLKYSINAGNQVAVESDINPKTINLSAGQTISFYADGSKNNSQTYFNIKCSADCYVYGNVMSLLDSNDYKDLVAIDKEYAFYALFMENTNIKNHPEKELCLPATSLTDNCYDSMFRGCTSITTAPKLPATNLTQMCYFEMFRDCHSLTKTPELKATELKPGCYFNMFQDCTSLKTVSSLPASKLTERCYSGMFRGCSSLNSTPSLPAMTLDKDCYTYMFFGCTSLENPPALPAEELKENCYFGMFRNCASLSSAPELPAKTLAKDCYNEMFRDCKTLSSAPVLTANILVDYCYARMFSNCSNLSQVTCLATDISIESCTAEWMYGVASNGTFTKAKGMNDWTNGINGVPDNWTIKDKN